MFRAEGCDSMPGTGDADAAESAIIDEMRPIKSAKAEDDSLAAPVSLLLSLVLSVSYPTFGLAGFFRLRFRIALAVN